MVSRYHGKPLYILLENLVLHSIGHLPEGRYERVAAMDDKLRQVFRHEGDWVVMLRAEFALAPDFDAKVQALWERHAAAARARGAAADPVAFAQWFVDAVFPLE